MRGLPSWWEWATIGEVGDAQLGRQRSPKWHRGPNMRPYLRVANVFEDRIDLSDVKEMDFPPDQYERFKLMPGDILLNEGQSPEWVGRPAMYRGELPGACFTNSLIRFRPNRGVDGRFALYLFRHHLHSGRFMREARITTNIAHLSLKRFAAVEFPVPPCAEQLRIVSAVEEHLSRLDAAEAALTAAGRRLVHFGEESARALFESQSWSWTTLGEIADIKGGVTKDSKRQADPSFVEVPYLRVANVQRGRLDLADVARIRVHPAKANALRLEAGDVLLNEGGDRDKLGRGWVWEGQIADCIHQNHVFRARLNGDFDPYFVSTHANTWGRAWFEQHGRQTTNLASINLGTLKRLPMPAPSRREQEAIVAQLRRSGEAQDRLVGCIGQARLRLASLRRSIFAAAFSGQLASQDPDDEPASVLLGRIRAERTTTDLSKRTRKVKVS